MSDFEARRRSEASDRRVALFFGGLMLVAGALIGGASGLCILAFSGGGGEMAGVACAIGGIPFAFGVVMFVCGIIVIVRQPGRPPPRRESLAATFSDDPQERRDE